MNKCRCITCGHEAVTLVPFVNAIWFNDRWYCAYCVPFAFKDGKVVIETKDLSKSYYTPVDE